MNAAEITTAYAIGLLATTSPCVFPLYPGYLAYLSSQGGEIKQAWMHYLLGPIVLAGVMTMMIAMGGLIALLAVSIGSVLRWIIPLADGLILTIGVLLLLNINPFTRLRMIQVPALRHPFANAFLYGLLYGPIALPCAAPLIVSVFALSLTAGQAVDTLGTFLWFGLGFGTPLLILSWIAGSTQRMITKFFARNARWTNRVAGVVLIAIAIYDLAVNWQNIL